MLHYIQQLKVLLPKKDHLLHLREDALENRFLQ